MDITALSSPSPSLSILLTISLPLHLLPPRLFLFSHFLSPSLCKQGADRIVRAYLHGRLCTNLHLLKEPAPACRKEKKQRQKQ